MERNEANVLLLLCSWPNLLINAIFSDSYLLRLDIFLQDTGFLSVRVKILIICVVKRSDTKWGLWEREKGNSADRSWCGHGKERVFVKIIEKTCNKDIYGSIYFVSVQLKKDFSFFSSNCALFNKIIFKNIFTKNL